MRWCCFKPGAGMKRGRRGVGRSKNARHRDIFSEPGPLTAALNQEQSARAAAVERLVQTAAFDESQPVRVGALQCLATMLAHPDFHSTAKEKAVYKVLAEALDIKNLHLDQVQRLRAVFLAVHSSVTTHGLRILGLPAGDKTQQLLKDLYRAALLQVQHHQKTAQTERLDNHIRNYSGHPADTPFADVQDIESNGPTKTAEEIEQQLERMMSDAPSPLASPHEHVPQYEIVPDEESEDQQHEENNQALDQAYDVVQTVEADVYGSYSNQDPAHDQSVFQGVSGTVYDQQMLNNMLRLATIEEAATEGGVGNSPVDNAQTDGVAYIQQPGLEHHEGPEDDCNQGLRDQFEAPQTDYHGINEVHPAGHEPEPHVEGVAYIETEPQLHVDGFEYVDADPRASFLAPEWEYNYHERAEGAGQHGEADDEQGYENAELNAWMQQEAGDDLVEYGDNHQEVLADQMEMQAQASGSQEPLHAKFELDIGLHAQAGDGIVVSENTQQSSVADEPAMHGHVQRSSPQGLADEHEAAGQTAVDFFESKGIDAFKQSSTSALPRHVPERQANGNVTHIQETVDSVNNMPVGGPSHHTPAETSKPAYEMGDKQASGRPAKRVKHLSRSVCKVAHRAKQALKQSHKAKSANTNAVPPPSNTPEHTAAKPSEIHVEPEFEPGWLPLPPTSSSNGSPHDTPIRQGSLSSHSAILPAAAPSNPVSRKATATSSREIHEMHKPTPDAVTVGGQLHSKRAASEVPRVESKSFQQAASHNKYLLEDSPQAALEPVDLDYLELQVQKAVRERIEAEAALQQHLSRLQATSENKEKKQAVNLMSDMQMVKDVNVATDPSVKANARVGVLSKRRSDDPPRITDADPLTLAATGNRLQSRDTRLGLMAKKATHSTVVTEEVVDKPLPISAPAPPATVQTMLIVTPPSKAKGTNEGHWRRRVVESDEDDDVLLPFQRASKAVPQSFSRTIIPPATIGKIDASQKRYKQPTEQPHEATEDDKPLVASNLRVATIVKNLQSTTPPAASSSIPRQQASKEETHREPLKTPAGVSIAGNQQSVGVTLTVAANKAPPSRLPSYMQPTAAVKARTATATNEITPALNTSSAWGASLRGDGKKPNTVPVSAIPSIRRTTTSAPPAAQKPTSHPPAMRRTTTSPASRLPKPTPLQARVTSLSYNSRSSYKDMTISSSLKSEAPVSAAIVSRLFPNARVSTDTYSSMRASDDRGRTSANNSLRASAASINRLASSRTASIAAKYGSRTTRESLGPDGRWP